MALNPKFFANLGKSIAYSALSVTGDLMPNSANIGRGIRSGADMTRDFLRTNQTRIRNVVIQNDRTQMSRKAKDFLADAWSDIKQGNLSLGDLSDQSMEAWDEYMDSFDDDSDGQRMEAEDGSAIEEPADSAQAVPPADFRVLEGMQYLSNSVSGATLKGFEYQTQQLSTALFSQMAASNQHFATIERQLQGIHEAINQQSEFFRDSQGVTNQAQLAFFDQITDYMKKAEKRAEEKGKTIKGRRKSANERFVETPYFDVSSYGDLIKDNISSTPLGMLASMTGFLDPDMIKMLLGGGPGGKFQPQKFLLNGAIRALMPKQARRALGRADGQVDTMLKTLLTTLGDYRYQMNDHPILGALGQVFGIDSRAGQSLNIGNYKKDEVAWNGESHHTLNVVIPKELAEIKAALTGQNAKYFDSKTGTFLSEDDVKENLQMRYQMALEMPFANLFNSMSLDPDEVRDKAIWGNMSKEAKDELSKLVQQAIDSREGTTKDIRTQLDAILKVASKNAAMDGKIAGENKEDTDGQRMTMKLIEAINSARNSRRSFMDELEQDSGAFGQLADKLANSRGFISMDKLREYVGTNGIDLDASNGGRYTLDGRRLDLMSEEAQDLYRSQQETMTGFLGKIRNLSNSDDPRLARIGKGVNKLIDFKTGVGGGRYSQAITDKIDAGSNAIYRMIMLGQMPSRGRAGVLPITPDENDQTGDYAPPPDNGPSDDGGSGGSPRLALPPHIPEDSEEEGDEEDEPPSRRNVYRIKRVRRGGGATTSASIADAAMDSDQNPENAKGPVQHSGIVNKAYDADVGNDDPETRIAEATEGTQERIEEAYGPKGFMRKVFDNPLIKAIFNKLKNSALGKAVGKQVTKGKEYFKQLFSEDYVDEAGETHKSVFSNLKDLGGQYKSMIMRTLGFDEEGEPDESAPEGTVVQAAREAAEDLKESSDELIGGDSGDGSKKKADAKKATASIMKQLNQVMRKHAPKALTGAVLGAGASLATGGHLGILGSMFLPGGPVGGAIAGMGISLLSRSEAVQSALFGKMGENGEREGGLINKEMQAGFKKALPTLGLGAGAGVILKVLGGAMGIGGKAAAIGGAVPAMLGPGGVMGAAILGSAAAFALKNQKVQDILFGEAGEDGKRTGALLSNMYNKLTGKIQGESGKEKKGLGKKALSLLKWAGMGAVGGATLSQMGILGGALSFGGPIGAAIAGATIGIFSSEERFQNYLFGNKDKEGKRKKDGLFSRISTAIELNLIEPAKNWFNTTAEQFAWHLKSAIEVPARLAFGPLIDGFKGVGQAIKMSIEDAFKHTAETIAKAAVKILSPLGKGFMNLVLKPLGGVAGFVAKQGLFMAGSLAGAPLQLLANLVAPKRRKGNKALSNYMRENKDEILQKRWADQEAETGKKVGFFNKLGDKMQMGLASNRFVGSLFHSNDVSGDAAEQFMQTEEGQQYDGLNWLSARSDDKKYRKAKKEAGKRGRERRKINKLRAKFGNEDGNNQDAILTVEQFEQRQKAFKKLGIDVADEDELKQVMYHYDAWEKAKNAPPEEKQEEERTDAETINDSVETVQEKQDEQTGLLRGILEVFTGKRTTDAEDAAKKAEKSSEPTNDEPGEKSDVDNSPASADDNDQSIKSQVEAQTETAESTAEMRDEQVKHTNIFQSISDTARAIFDLMSGKSLDSSDIEPGELAEAVDDKMAGDAQATEAQLQGKAFAQEMANMNERQKKIDDRNAEHALITGNDSGDAHDSDFDYTNNDSDEAQEVLAASAEDNDQSGTGGGFLGGILSNFLTSAGGIAAIGGLVVALLSNKELRDALFGLLGDLMGNLPDIIKQIGDVASNIDTTISGKDGGVGNQRVLSVDENGDPILDENGNPEEVVTNTKYERGKFDLVRNLVARGGKKLSKWAGKGAVKFSKWASKLTKVAGGDPSTITRYKLGKNGDNILTKLFGAKQAQEMTAEEVAKADKGILARLFGGGKKAAEEGAEQAGKKGGFLSKFFGGGKKVADAAVDAVDDVADDVLEGQLSLFPSAAKAAEEGAEQVGKKGGFLSKFFGGGKKAASAAVDAVDDVADDVLEQAGKGGFLSKAGNFLKNGVEKIADTKFGQTLAKGLDAAKGGIDDAAKAVSGSNFGQTVAKGASKLKGYVDDAAQALSKSKAGKTAGKVWNGVKEVTEKVVEDSNDGIFAKILGMIKNGIEAACTKSGFAETAVGKILKKAGSFIDDIIKKCAGKLAKWSDDLAGAMANMSGKMAAWATPAAILNAAVTAVETVDAAANPEMIFKIDEKHVDAKMRLVAGAIQFLLSFFGAGAVISIVSAIVADCCGFDFIQSVACIIYDILATDEEAAALDEAIDNMKQEVANYNEANNTNLSVTAYNDLKNKGMVGTAWNFIKGLVGKGDKTDYSQYEVGNYKSPVGNGPGIPESQGNSGQNIGMGPGMQNDPRWANMPIGTMPDGQTSTMATGGCGPTALSNAANMLGYGTNPADMANMAITNKYIAKGGASADLFDKGASQIGLDSQRIGTGQDIVNSLKNGRPVILSGKSSGYGGDPYTKAGHIVTATGMDASGNVQIEDPMRGTGSYKLNDITGKMTNAWSIGDKKTPGYGEGSRGRVPTPAGYGITDTLFGDFFSKITDAVGVALLGDSYKPAAGATESPKDTGNNGGSGGGGSSSIANDRTYSNELGAVSAMFESHGDPSMVSSGKGDAGGRSFGTYQFPSYKHRTVDSGTMLAQFWNKYYGDRYPNVKPGDNDEFISAWKNEANADPTGFHTHEHEFITDQYYKPIVNANSNVMDPDAHSRAAQEIWWSTGVQFGPNTKILRRALEGKDPANMTPTDLITTVMDYKTQKVPDYFPSSTGCWKGLTNRFNVEERNALLGIADQHPIGSTAKQSKIMDELDRKKYNIPHGARSAMDLMYDEQNLGFGPGPDEDEQPQGYGLLDGIFSTFTDAIGSKVISALTNGTVTSIGGSSGSSGGSYDSSGTWVPPAEDNTNYAALPTSDQQVALVNKMKSIAGTIPYSLQGPQDPDKGSASCASTVAWAYNKVLGFKPGVGGNCVNGENHASSTNQATDDRFVTIYQNDGNNQIDFSKLQPGDIVYQNWDRTSYNGKLQHTEMYAGDGTDMSHGGSPHMGPVTKDMNDYRQKHTMLIRRYKGFMQDTTAQPAQEERKIPHGARSAMDMENESNLGFGPGPVGFGPGACGFDEGSPLCLSKTGQNTASAARPMGYGAKANDNHGVETRLDSIIGLMRTIIEKAASPKPQAPAITNNNTTVNYGPAPQQNVQPVVIKENNRMLGRYDAEQSYLRQRHQQVASAYHA